MKYEDKYHFIEDIENWEWRGKLYLSHDYIYLFDTTDFKTFGYKELDNYFLRVKNEIYTAKAPTTKWLLQKLYDFKIISEKSYQKWNINFNVIEKLMDLNNKVINPFENLLRDYQYQGYLWLKAMLSNYNAAGMFWEMRTGKTRVLTKIANDFNKTIILSLAGQQDNWLKELKIWNPEHKIYLIKKLDLEQRNMIYQDFNKDEKAILIVSIDTITKDITEEHFINLKKFDLLIIDEIHKIKNKKTRFYKGCKFLAKNAKNKIGITGTPISKNNLELVSIINFLYKQYSSSYLIEYFFDNAFNYYAQTSLPTTLNKNLNYQWVSFLNKLFSSLNQKEVFKYLDNKNKYDLFYVDLPLNNLQKMLYNHVLNFAELLHQNGEIEQIQEIIVILIRLRQIAVSPRIFNYDDVSNKELWLLNYLKQHPQEKILVFSFHTTYLKQLLSILQGQNYKVGIICGETHNKAQIQAKFQNNEYDILLLNIQSGSKGLTLDKATTTIFLDQDWRPDENLQAIERMTNTTNNDNQIKKKVYKLFSVSKNTISNKNLENIDYYINEVVEQKITKTEITNNFKTILKILKLQ